MPFLINIGETIISLAATLGVGVTTLRSEWATDRQCAE